MSKTLCKWPRKEIADSFDELCQVVARPAFVCRSCARSASAASFLCKPMPLETDGPLPRECVLEAADRDAHSDNVGVRIVEPVEPAIKQTKKALKRQKKANKKLAKLAKQQKKWAKKQKKLERSFQKLQKHFPVYIDNENPPIH